MIDERVLSLWLDESNFTRDRIRQNLSDLNLKLFNTFSIIFTIIYMFTHVYYNSILYTVTVKLISIGSRPEEFAKIFLARFLIIFFIIFTILYICLHVYIIILFYIQSVNINWIPSWINLCLILIGDHQIYL